MSNSNNIKLLLDIQDKNIEFEKDAVELKVFKGVKSKFITATLSFTPAYCECCGVKNEDYTVYKNGTKTSRITLPMSGIYPTYLNLKKQRFYCKACHGSFSASTSIVQKHCFISDYTKAKVLVKSTDAQSLTDIAKDCLVSTATVQRVISSEAKKYHKQYQPLPKHLSFDEFKYQKGRMAFEYINAETGDIIDILERRDAWTIKEHFIRNYHLKDLKKVETVTIDMNAGYVNVIKEIFPRAKIIIDRFHIVQLISRSMNQSRIRIMNRFNTSNGENKKKYRRLKKYWRLILKSKHDLSHTDYKYYPLFGQRIEASVIDELLNYDEDLKSHYDLYQSLMECVKEKDFATLNNILLTVDSSIYFRYMKTSIKTLKKHLTYIRHSLIYPYNNGRIEGINNKIKVLNRVAYGYRNFHNFKKRIILHFKLRTIIQRKKSSSFMA